MNSMRPILFGAMVFVYVANLFADEGRPQIELVPPGGPALQVQRLPSTGTTGEFESSELAYSSSGFSSVPVRTQNSDASSPAQALPDLPTVLSFGYDRGFVIAADQADGFDANSVDFLMRINSWSQLRHTLFDSDGPNPDQNTISFERLRLAFSGHAFSTDLKYFFQFDGNSDNRTDVIFLDHFATYDVGRHLFCWEADRLGVKLGKWKVPFSRSREESGRRLQFTERTTANVFFDLNRSVGVGLFGQLGDFEMPIQVESALFNGIRTRSISTNRARGETDTNLAVSFRAYKDFVSEFGDDGEPDLSWHTIPTLRIGGGMAYSRVNERGTIEFSRSSVVDSGATLAAILPAGVSAYDVWLYTVDVHLKYRGFSIIVDYYWRYLTQFRGGSIPSLFDDGFLVQAGYFVVPQKLELLFRWARLAGDSGALGLVNQSSDEVAGGFAWYFNGHNAKLVFDATHHNGAPIGEVRIDTLPGDIGWLYRTQIQLAF